MSMPNPTLLIISLEIVCTRIIPLQAHLPCVYCICVKFPQFRIILDGEVAITRHLDGRTDGQTE